ncbi:MAG: ADP-ribosylation factor-like protein [bacterium]
MKELNGILDQLELKNVPIVILGNKIDKKEACTEEELR